MIQNSSFVDLCLKMCISSVENSKEQYNTTVYKKPRNAGVYSDNPSINCPELFKSNEEDFIFHNDITDFVKLGLCNTQVVCIICFFQSG